MSKKTLSFTQKVFFATEKLKAFVSDLNYNFTELYDADTANVALRRVKTKAFTIGAVGVAGCDKNFDTAANTTQQVIELVGAVPSTARILDVVWKTNTAFAGTSITAFTMECGTTSSGAELFADTDVIAANALAQPAVGASFTLTAITHAAKSVYVSAAPTGGNWAALLAGKGTIYITYIDNLNA